MVRDLEHGPPLTRSLCALDNLNPTVRFQIGTEQNDDIAHLYPQNDRHVVGGYVWNPCLRLPLPGKQWGDRLQETHELAIVR